MNVVVLGGTRFIGPQVVARLVGAGHRVTVFHRGVTEAALPPGVARIHGDRNALAAHAEPLLQARPDVVVDMIALSARHAESLLAVFGGRVRHAVVASSLDVYRAWARFHRLEAGPPDPVPLGVDAPLRERPFPRRPRAAGPADWRWDYDKLHVEQALTDAATLPTTILRLPYTWGPGDYRRRLEPVLRALHASPTRVRMSRARAQWRCTRGFVRDVAQAIADAALADTTRTRICNVGAPEALTEAEWFQRIAAAVGWTGRLAITDEAPGAPTPVHWDQHVVLDVDRAAAPSTALTSALEQTLGRPG